MIYLDHNATTKPSAAARAAALEAIDALWQNPSSVHRAGQAVRARVELARKHLAALVGGKPREVTLTSGGTESIDLAIRGVMQGAHSAPHAPRRVLVTTRTEHSAVRDLAEHLGRLGIEVRWAPLGPGGVVDLGALAGLIDSTVALVSIQWANNETGTIQPVRDIAALAHRAGALYHCDGVQWVGRMPAEAAAEGIDFLSYSAHKFHGVKGAGCLWVRPGVRLTPTLRGTQELGRRGGTEAVPAVLAAGEAAREALARVQDTASRDAVAALRDRFESLVLAAVPGTVRNTAPQRLWTTSSLGFPGLEAEALLLLLSEQGVCASAGAACSSGSLEPSPVLLAMGVEPRVAHGSLRFSFSHETTPGEVEQAAAIVARAVATLRRTSPV